MTTPSNCKVLPVLLSVVLCAGCSRGPSGKASDAGALRPTSAAANSSTNAGKPPVTTARVWFLDDNRMRTGTEPLLMPVERQVPGDTAMQSALEALFAGPTSEERARGLRFVASGATGFGPLRLEAGVAHLYLTGGCNSGGSTVTIASELLPTLKQFPGVEAVKIYDPAGKTEEPHSRGDSIPACLEP